MQSRFFRWLGLVLLGSLVGAEVLGCAQSRDPINRVQANALDKHFFVGPNLSNPSDDPEFYMGHRIIDEPYGVGQDFSLYQSMGSLARIKWEIQEDKLVARLTYERIQNSDHNGSQATDNGQVVAEFKIASHFDIKRDYNPQTGEQLNLIVENTTDRPWYEREFFRVDWSTNLVTDAYDFDVLAQGAAIDGIKYDPLSYYVEDPNDPDAPVFSNDEGYFDITTKLFATPQIVDTPYGTFPACMLLGVDEAADPSVTCSPAEVKVRFSFKKVVDDDFEPEDWDGNKMQAFGWFTQDRFGYERNYGILDQNWHRFASKFNIWQKSHVAGTQCAVDAWRDDKGNVQNYKVDAAGNFVTDKDTGLPIPDPNGQPFRRSAPGLDVHRDVDGDGTEDECQFTRSVTPTGIIPPNGLPSGDVVSPGSRCDEFKNKCDIPLYMRSTKTTPLYFGPTAPADLFASTAKALNSWNIAVKRAAMIGKYVEVNRTPYAYNYPGSQDDSLRTEAGLLADQQSVKPVVPDIFVLCHNPVMQGDDPSCGKPGLKVRLGDLRYSVVDVIQNPQYPSAWGIMTDFDDPVTGEKVQASINEWAYVLDIAAQNTEDLLRWINGEITNDQISNGQYMQQWVSANKLGSLQHTPKVLSKQEIESRLNSIDKSIGKLNGVPAGTPLGLARQIAAKNLSQNLGPSLDAEFEATRQSLLGSEWEARMITPNMLQMAGLDPKQPFAGDPTTLNKASPLRALNPMLRKWGRGVIDKGLVAKNMCIINDEPEPDSLVGLARQALQLFPLPDSGRSDYQTALYNRNQALHQWLREQFHLSVIAHEMGHAMGLRHNFAGSWDALNYHTEYWQLRTRNGVEHYCGYPGRLDATTPHTDGTDCVGPRWVDPVTDQETNGLLWKWGSSTVMDYPGDQTQDTNDIGLYDKAAMRFGYANVVDVEKNMTVTVVAGAPGGSGIDFVGAAQLLDGFGGIFGFGYGNLFGGIIPNHYSTYADKYGLLGDCSQDRPGWNGDKSDPLAKQCIGSAINFAAERDMRSVPKGLNATTDAPFAVDKNGHVRHPYMMGSDEFVDFGNVPVFRFDAGADAYEQMQFFTSSYENRYIFDNFRRNRVSFHTPTTVDRVQSRYWDKVQGVTKSLALGIEEFTQPNFDPTQYAGLFMPMALASADGLAMFVRALTRPEPGAYSTPTKPGPLGPPNAWSSAATGTAGPSLINVSLGDGQGRFLHNDYDYTKGYYWYDYQIQVGSAFEKYWVPYYLTESYNQFISNQKDDYIDGRYKNLSYVSIYPNQVRRILANLMATESATQTINQGASAQIFTLAPFTTPNGQAPTSTVQYLAWDRYDPNDSSTTELQYPPGAVLLDPLVGWEEQYRALVDLFHFGRTSLSMDLIDQMRIFSPGDAASLSIPVGQQVRYRDPLTGIEYVAKNYGTEVVNSAIGFQTAKTVGARMLQHANVLAKAAYQVSTPPDPVTGELTYDTDPQGNVIPNSASGADTAATMLKNYASNIDVVRQLTRFFGYGPLSSTAASQHP
jgi:hypothetical protein